MEIESPISPLEFRDYALIAPTDLRDYAKSQGWRLFPDIPKSERIYVMDNPSYPKRQLVFPMDTSAPDYAEAIKLMVEKLAAMEARVPDAVLRSLLDVGNDALSFRVITPHAEDLSLPLSFAGSIISGAQQLLLISASNVMKPQVYHPRLSRNEAQQVLEAARFRHTQPGSFILNVACPVNSLNAPIPLLPDYIEMPFMRRATVTLQRSLHRLVEAIEQDTVPQLVDSEITSEAPLISSNLCDALAHFEDNSLKNSVEIKIKWAASIPRPANEASDSIVRIQHDYFARIEEVGRELRSTSKPTDGTFIGTVERLDGEMDPDGRRSGVVILSLLLPEGDQVRARTVLNPEQYEKANLAHMTEGVYVIVTGRLYPGRQPRQLSNLHSLELISPTKQ